MSPSLQQKPNKRSLVFTFLIIVIPLFLVVNYLFSFYNTGKPYDLGHGIRHVKTDQSHGCPILCDSSGTITSYFYVTSGGTYDSLANHTITALKKYGFYYDKKASGAQAPVLTNHAGNYLNLDIAVGSEVDYANPAAKSYCPKNCSIIELDYFH